MTHVRVPVKDLKEGDLVDLEGDAFADPDRDPMSTYIYEYGAVAELTTIDRSGEIVVDFENVPSCLFPREHKVRVIKL